MFQKILWVILLAVALSTVSVAQDDIEPTSFIEVTDSRETFMLAIGTPVYRRASTFGEVWFYVGDDRFNIRGLGYRQANYYEVELKGTESLGYVLADDLYTPEEAEAILAEQREPQEDPLPTSFIEVTDSRETFMLAIGTPVYRRASTFGEVWFYVGDDRFNIRGLGYRQANYYEVELEGTESLGYVLADDLYTPQEAEAILAEQSEPAETSQANTQNGILFQDDFEDGNVSQWNYGDALSLELMKEDNNSFLSLSTDEDWGDFSSQIGSDWENYSFSFRFRMVNFDTNSPTPHLFINSRSSDEGAYSAFIWMRESRNMLTFGGQLGGEFGALNIQRLDFGTPAIVEANVWHSIEIIVNANVIELYLDHTLVERLGEDELSYGNISFGLSPNVLVHIDDVTVSKVESIETVILPTIVPTTEVRIGEMPECDVSSLLAETSLQVLSGTLQSGVNMRSAPNTQSSIVTFINQGERVEISELEALGEYTRVGNLKGSTVWAKVVLQRDNDNREGYIWANVLEIMDHGDGFSNPLDDCFDINLPDGFSDALASEFGSTWASFINCNDVYFAGCSLYAVLDGEYITTPIKVYDISGELIGTSHISMRAFYLDAFGELQYVILPIYFESSTGQAFDLAPGTLLPPTVADFTAETMLNIYSRQYDDMLGRVTCVGIIKDIEGWKNRNRDYLDQGESPFIEFITIYGLANKAEIDQFIISGNSQVGVLFSDNAIFNSCIADQDGSGDIALDN